MRILHVDRDSRRGGSMLCLGCGAYITNQGLTRFVDFWLEFSRPFSRLGSPYFMCLTQKLLFEQCQDLLLPGYTCLPPARHHVEDWPSIEMCHSLSNKMDGGNVSQEACRAKHGPSEVLYSSIMLQTGNLMCLWNLEKEAV